MTIGTLAELPATARYVVPNVGFIVVPYEPSEPAITAASGVVTHSPVGWSNRSNRTEAPAGAVPSLAVDFPYASSPGSAMKVTAASGSEVDSAAIMAQIMGAESLESGLGERNAEALRNHLGGKPGGVRPAIQMIVNIPLPPGDSRATLLL